jgi:hypothetical protein
MDDEGGATIREAVAVFDDVQVLEAAVDELSSTGFDRAAIGLLADPALVEAKLGHRFRQVADLEDDGGAPWSFYVAKEAIGPAEGAMLGGLLYAGVGAAAGAAVAGGATLTAALTSASFAGGTGGQIGAALAKLVGDRHAQQLLQQLDRGSLVLWVHAGDKAHEDRATAILSRRSGRDAHVYDLPVD